MARPPKNVKIGSTTLNRVLSVQMSVERSVDDRGQPGGTTLPVHVVIVRDATHDAQVDGFKNVTNGNGKDAQITAEFTIPKDADTAAYTVQLTRAHVAGWQLVNSGDDNEPAREIIELYAGALDVTAGSAKKSLNLKGYKI